MPPFPELKQIVHDRKAVGDGDRYPPPTGYLVIPAYAGDSGARPLPQGIDPLHNPSIHVIAKNGLEVTWPVAGNSYTLRCAVTNRGKANIYGGIAHFYTKAGGHALPSLHAMAAFRVKPGGSTVVQCPRQWVPANQAEAEAPLLVCVFDILMDPAKQPYDFRGDRHVACKAPVNLTVLDQVNNPEWRGAATNIDPANGVNQTFKPALPKLVAVEVGLRTGNPGRGDDNVTLTVLDQSTATSSTRRLKVKEGFEGFLRFDLTKELPVTVDSLVTIALSDTGKGVFHWKYTGGNTYGRGNALFRGKPFADNDFYFKTYGKR